ncbi:hypothetical protein UB45_22085, partial [Terrabacter sp. 28]
MVPAAVPQALAAGALERGPKVRGVTEATRPQLEADEAGEGLLGCAADPAAPDGLSQRRRLREVCRRR